MAKAIDGSASALGVAVLTVSDTRSSENDTSGDFLAAAAAEAGHSAAGRAIVVDDIYQIRALVSNWIAAEAVDAILITGGTGFSGRDSTPEAVASVRMIRSLLSSRVTSTRPWVGWD